MSIRIREFVPSDAERVIELWETRGLTRPWNDPRAENDAVLAFCDALGYEPNDVLVRGKRLIEDGARS